LSVHDLAPYYLPGPYGAEPITFWLKTDPADQILASEGKRGIQVEADETPGRYRIRLAPERHIASLTLVHPRPAGPDVHLPIRLRAPRLRWMLRLDGQDIPWTTSPRYLPVDKLLQARQAHLILDWEGAREAPRGRILLLDIEAEDENQRVLKEEVLPDMGIANRAMLSLTTFFDTIRFSHDRSLLTLALALYGKVAENADIPLLSLQRDMAITGIWPEWSRDNTLTIHWQAEHRLRNRRLRLWSAWRPWEPPREYVIPDDVGPEHPEDPPGSGAFTVPEPLPYGPYWIAFRTAPSWEARQAPPMPTATKYLLTVPREKARARLEAIQEQWMEEEGSAFFAAFERACIFHLMDIATLRDQEIETAIQELLHGTPQAIIALNQCLQRFDLGLAPKLRTMMYRPEALKRLYSSAVSGEVEDAYLADLSKTKLVNSDSAMLLLRHSQYAEARAYATEVLLRRIHPDEVEVHINLVQEGFLTDEMVLELWDANPDSAIKQLNAMPEQPDRDRLLEKIALQTQSTWVVRPGIWVRTKAGWGKVTRILVDGATVPYLIRDEQGHLPGNAILEVELPRKDRIWSLKVDAGAKRVYFEGASKLWVCTKEGCAGFAAVNLSEIENEHNRAAHGGLGPSFKPISSSWRYYKPLQFSWDEQNPYA